VASALFVTARNARRLTHMHSFLTTYLSRSGIGVALSAAAFFVTSVSSYAQVDEQINRSVWKQKFGVLDAQMNEQAPYSGWLSMDADGDGVCNRNEFVAGTNPFHKAASDAHFRVPRVTGTPSTLALTFPTVPGKLYGVESNMELVGAWSKESLPDVVGDGTLKTLNVSKSAGSFFRLTVKDRSSQNDQVSDWSKQMLGLSPNVPLSSQSSFDSNSLAASLEAENIITLQVVDAYATQPENASSPAEDSGLIRVTRSGYRSLGPVTVPISIRGTAAENVDFDELPKSVTFPAGVRSLDVKITPRFNTDRTSSATVFVTLASAGTASAAGNYSLSSPFSAAVTVMPSGSPTGSGLSASYYPGSNSSYTHAANFGGAAATYSYTKVTTSNGLATITYTGTPAQAFTVGGSVALQFTSGNLNVSPYNTTTSYTITALPTNLSFTIAITGNTVPSSTTLGNVTIAAFSPPLNRIDPLVDFTWGTDAPDSLIPANNYSVRWTGQILPQYSQIYYFATRADDGSKLWVNNQLIVDNWNSMSEKTGSIYLQANVRYDIRMEYVEHTGSAEVHLSWYSNDQAKQIIPTKRLFPTMSGTTAPFGSPPAAAPSITSSTDAVAIVGASNPFAMSLTSSNGGTITASGLPSWLTFANGILSGTPTEAGFYQFTLTTANSSGSSSSVMSLNVLENPGQLTREQWTSGVTGPAISDVPWNNVATASDTIRNADSSISSGDNSGERLRGYFTAPATGNYYFWVAASNVAELWISNNAEPVNKVLRAKVTGPTGTAPNTWNVQPGQKSPWLSLIAGETYYLEALHNTGASGTSSHLSVAWFLDPTGNTTSPAITLIPSHVLSPWDNPPTTTIPGSLYGTNLQGAEGLTGITGSGGAFLRVNGSTAVLQLKFMGLTSGITSRKIFRKINANTSAVVFDLDAQDRNYPGLKTSDGGYTWNMLPSDMADLESGKVFLSLSTLNHPAGELTGTFGKVSGSQTAPPMPSTPAWLDLHASSDEENSRFLTQATFGPSPSDMAEVKAVGYRSWIEAQFAISATKNVPYVLANLSADPQNPYVSTLMFNSWWKNSITAPDQLRQRAAFALSEILVVSDVGPLNNNGRVLADYYDTLLDSSFGSFRDILKQVTLSPAMGVYLDMRANASGSLITGIHPNENYAREILQLFSAGLYKTWADGTLVLDSSGNPVATYDQEVISGMARVFTGWNWGQPLLGTGRMPTSFGPASNFLDPMVLVPSRHELGSKALLDNVVLPPSIYTDSATTLVDTDPIFVQTSHPTNGQGFPITTPIYNRYDLNGLKDLEAALDNIMANSAVGPYICRQLIQRLVTSHPKPEYVHRVVRAFNGERNIDGVATGIRGDMKEVFRAILLDYEARSPDAAADPKFGKQREPLMRVTGPARAFPAASFPNSTYTQSGLQAITVTTPTAHRLVSGESVRLSNFSDAGSSANQLPTTQTYQISNVTTNSFTVNNNATSTATYTILNDVATINSSGFAVGDQLYISFTSGGLSGAGSVNHAPYTISAVTATSFSVVLPSVPSVTTGGSCLIPRLSSGYNVTTAAGIQTILIQTSGNHNLVAGDSVYLKFAVLNSPLPAINAVYSVYEIAGPNSFKVLPQPSGSMITNGSQGSNSVIVYPLKGSHWTRSGTVTVELNTWGIGSTPNNLNQTPLNSSTVFNFFYPDYQFPGEIAKAGMTTPEFQLTNDSNTMNLTNLITQGTLTNNTGNPNGYISVFSSNAITMDLAPYMTIAQTNNAGVPTLVNNLGILLTGGDLSSAVKNTIINYVTNTTSYPFASPTPTANQMRDRVRAIIHLIVTSAEYAIQR
jgi:uncharacterized protein (DUF1800 family)